MPQFFTLPIRPTHVFLVCALLWATERSAGAGEVPQAAAALKELRVDLSYFKCVDPPDVSCTAVGEQSKARCPTCRGWEPQRLAYRPEPALTKSASTYHAKANIFFRDTVESVYGLKYPTSQGQPVRVQDLYKNPKKFGWIEVPPNAVGPGTLVAFQSSLGGLIVNGGQTSSLDVVFPSAKARGALRKDSLADLVKDSGKAKFLIPKDLTASPPSESLLQVVKDTPVKLATPRLNAAALSRLEQVGNLVRQTPGAEVTLMEFDVTGDNRVADLTKSAHQYLVSAGIPKQQIRTVTATDTAQLTCGPVGGLCMSASSRGVTGGLTATVTFSPGEYWNTWTEEAAPDEEPRFDKNLADELQYQPVWSLQPNRKYMLVLHLSGFPYDSEKPSWSLQSRPVGVDFADALTKLLKKKNKTSWDLRVIVFPGPLLRNEPTVIQDSLHLNLDRIAAFRKGPRVDLPANPFSELAGDRNRPYAFGEIAFAIETGSKIGSTSVGLSLWDESSNRPIDEITIPLCINTNGGAPCPKAVPYLGLAGPGLIDLATGSPPESLPDGSLHIFEIGERIVGVFHRQDLQGTYQPWIVSRDPLEFKDSLKSLQADFGKGMNPVQVGKDLAGQLFPRDDTWQKAALEQFRDFLNHRGASTPFGDQPPPRLFVRMVLGAGGNQRSSLFPVGLLHISMADDDSFVGYRFRIEAPLPHQTYQSPEHCLAQWLLVVPPENADNELQKGRNILKQRLGSLDQFTMAKSKYPAYENFSTFLKWLNEAALRGGDSAAVVVLSHHDEKNLSFTPKEEPLRPESLQSLPGDPFSGPSLAVLDSCSGLTYGADTMVKELNARGVETVIATNNQVSGELAGNFLECMVAALETALPPAISVSDLFYKAQQCLWKRKEFGPQVLSFSLAGNPSVTLCSPRTP